MKREVYEKLFGDILGVTSDVGDICYSPAPAPHEMGLAPGGRMRQ